MAGFLQSSRNQLSNVCLLAGAVASLSLPSLSLAQITGPAQQRLDEIYRNAGELKIPKDFREVIKLSESPRGGLALQTGEEITGKAGTFRMELAGFSGFRLDAFPQTSGAVHLSGMASVPSYDRSLGFSTDENVLNIYRFRRFSAGVIETRMYSTEIDHRQTLVLSIAGFSDPVKNLLLRAGSLRELSMLNFDAFQKYAAPMLEDFGMNVSATINVQAIYQIAPQLLPPVTEPQQKEALSLLADLDAENDDVRTRAQITCRTLPPEEFRFLSSMPRKSFSPEQRMTLDTLVVERQAGGTLAADDYLTDPRFLVRCLGSNDPSVYQLALLPESLRLIGLPVDTVNLPKSERQALARRIVHQMITSTFDRESGASYLNSLRR